MAEMRRKYASLSGRPGARRHARRLAGDLRDRLDRRAEDVAVVELRPAAERPHRLAELRLDDRVDDDRRPSAHTVDNEPEVGRRLDSRVADLAKLLLRELGLECLDESLRSIY